MLHQTKLLTVSSTNLKVKSSHKTSLLVHDVAVVYLTHEKLLYTQNIYMIKVIVFW